MTRWTSEQTRRWLDDGTAGDEGDNGEAGRAVGTEAGVGRVQGGVPVKSLDPFGHEATVGGLGELVGEVSLGHTAAEDRIGGQLEQREDVIDRHAGCPSRGRMARNASTSKPASPACFFFVVDVAEALAPGRKRPAACC